MTKKDFIALADAIREHNIRAENENKQVIACFASDHLRALADFCVAQNPRFNRDRWLGYIAGENGPSGGKV